MLNSLEFGFYLTYLSISFSTSSVLVIYHPVYISYINTFEMGRIAIAGGAGGLGKTFVEAFAKTKHEVLVLSRSVIKSFIKPLL